MGEHKVRKRRAQKRLSRPQLWVIAAGVLLFATACPRDFAQISPGPLSKSHASLSGTTHCNSCHQFGSSSPTFKCLDCHKEVAEALAGKHGYHAGLQIHNPNRKDCVRCHLEHNGESFNLVRWEPSKEKFDHRLTGYKLEGKHTTVACEKCHTPTHMLPDLKLLIQYRDPARSFFAQSPACSPCHTDPHKGQLGSECAKCHNVESWKALKEFDHSKTRYSLTGLHVKVECEKCHKPDTPGGPARYADMKFAACKDCHTDPHRGELKKACATCHTTAGWKSMLSSYDFDHSTTKYPLQGKHATVLCTACHTGGDFKKKISFAKCTDCHKPDPHKGQFAAREQKGECAECHNLEGWKPSLFGVRQHDSSQYALRGKHITVDCAKCHIPAGKGTIYKVKFGFCTDCHVDAHANQFAAAPYSSKCEGCHAVTGWHRTTYTIANHKGTRFALTGAHAAVACSDCHKVGLGGRTDGILPFRFEDRTCTACHKDPHNGEFNERMAKKSVNGTPLGCEACHTVKSWGKISGFDHGKTKFALLGAHRSVPCAQCHKATTSYQSRYKGTAQQCEACHFDAHDRQFLERERATHCVECHYVVQWVPSTFDHDANTRFALTGRHAQMPCGRCHVKTRKIGDKEIVVYTDTPNRCADCHGDRSTNPPQEQPSQSTSERP